MKFAGSMLVALLVVIYTVSDSDAQCICGAVYDPVCGSNGRTYGNSCELECDRSNIQGLRQVSRGQCGNNNNGGGGGPSYPPRPGPGNNNNGGCFCITQYDPVCGNDGRTYGNSCELGCAQGVRLAYRGQCRGRRY